MVAFELLELAAGLFDEDLDASEFVAKVAKEIAHFSELGLQCLGDGGRDLKGGYNDTRRSDDGQAPRVLRDLNCARPWR